MLCANQIDPVAQNILNMYPLPNTSAYSGIASQNYIYTLRQPQFTFQWDARMDWNPTEHDQAFARFSFLNQRGNNQAPLGPVLDGGGGNGSNNVSGEQLNYGNNFVGSETHIFSPRLVNEFRFAYDYGHFGILNPGYNITGQASSLGLGGVPEGPDFPLNGGLPTTTISGGGGIASFGAHAYRPEVEYENEYQILDNVSWTLGNHSLRLGVSYQSIRSDTLEPPSSHPAYTFSGAQTGQPGVANTGSGIADFLTDNMSNGSIGPSGTFNDAQNLIAGYVQDDWRATRKLTLNLGVRYEHFQPYKEMAGKMANFYATSVGVSTGTGVYVLPSRDRNIAINQSLPERAGEEQHRIAVRRQRAAYQCAAKPTSRRASVLLQRHTAHHRPWRLRHLLPGPAAIRCAIQSCDQLSFRLQRQLPGSFVYHWLQELRKQRLFVGNGLCQRHLLRLTTTFSTPALVGQSPDLKTTYAEDFNLAVEQAFTNTFVFTLSYVGNNSRHLPSAINSNSTAVLLPSGSTQAYLPFPSFGASSNLLYIGISGVQLAAGQAAETFLSRPRLRVELHLGSCAG